MEPLPPTTRSSSPPATASTATVEGALAVVLLAAVVAALLTWLPWLHLLAYPFRLLTTLAHEMSHGLAALLTGGRFERFVVYSDGSGVALTAGGWRFVVIASGYLGAALFGAGMIWVGAIPRARRWALGSVGVVALVLSLRYGLPSLLSRDWLAGLLTIASGSVLGGACVALALKAGRRWVLFAVHLIAFQAGLTSLADLLTLIGLANAGSEVATDARSMAQLTHLPAVLWALLWALSAAGLLGASLWAAARRWERAE